MQSLERDLQEAKAAAQEGKLKPLPGETVSGAVGERIGIQAGEGGGLWFVQRGNGFYRTGEQDAGA